MPNVIQLLENLKPSKFENGFNVINFPNSKAYYVGKDSEGHAAILIKTEGNTRRIPLQLATIEARFDLPCRITPLDGRERLETLTYVLCKHADIIIQNYFLRIFELLHSELGDAPNVDAVGDTVEKLSELFQALRIPARKSILGLIGELIVINLARDTSSALRAWRADTNERYDFSVAGFKLEAKTCLGQERRHHFSYEQVNLPPSVSGLVASIQIEFSVSGTSTSELMVQIEEKVSNHLLAMKLRKIVAETLGADLPAALTARFDLQRARGSCAFYDLRQVPRIQETLAQGVSRVKFVSDLSYCEPISNAEIRSLASEVRAMLPM